MKKLMLIQLVVFAMLGSFFAQSASSVEYPVIKGYGPVTPLPDAAVQPDKSLKYKVLFDITRRARRPHMVNPGLSHVARFINVMASAGVSSKDLELVVILHGRATSSALKSDLYRAMYKVENPNSKLIQDLKEAGVELLVSGQSLADYKYLPEWVNPRIKVALSALVVVPTYELKGYAHMP